MVNKTNDKETLPVRIDKWLWAARFYKTRVLASQAVKSGKIQVNASKVKASRAVVVGDCIKIRKSDLNWTLEVLALSAHRGPAKQAMLLYKEDAASVTARTDQSHDNRLLYHAAPKPGKKPDKRERRQWSKLTDIE